MTDGQKELLRAQSDALAPKVEEAVNAPKLALEIGFGAGEHLHHIAGHNPDTLYIGAEPFIGGVAKLLMRMDKEPRENIRVYPDDARLLMDSLPDACLDTCYVLFPDPWPKPRHFKRRLIQKPFLDAIARLLKPSGELLLATDHRDYSIWMLEQLLSHGAYQWGAECASDWTSPPEHWVPTRYEQKTGEQGREPVFLRFSLRDEG